MDLYTITEMAERFDVSTRTIRFYEEKGLIFPTRSEKGQRLYSKKDRVRMRLILRGKRFGFSLDEISEMVLLFDVDRSGKKQLEVTVEYGKNKIKEIDQKIADFKALKEEMEELQIQFEKKLADEKECKAVF